MDEYGKVIGEGTVRFERLLPGPIERVWAYLTEPDKRGEWLARGDMELREGGAVLLHFRPLELAGDSEPVPEERLQHAQGADGTGTIGTFDPPWALSIIWDESGGHRSELLFELTAEGERVRLVLTQRDLRSRAEMVDVSGGWHIHLDILSAVLEDREPPPFWATIAALEAEYQTRLP